MKDWFQFEKIRNSIVEIAAPMVETISHDHDLKSCRCAIAEIAQLPWDIDLLRAVRRINEQLCVSFTKGLSCRLNADPGPRDFDQARRSLCWLPVSGAHLLALHRMRGEKLTSREWERQIVCTVTATWTVGYSNTARSGVAADRAQLSRLINLHPSLAERAAFSLLIDLKPL
jgi:hypothetical protein